MVRDPEILVRLRRLQAEIAVDTAALRERERETRDLATRWDAGGSIGRPELALLAVNLHAWYTAFESLLERVARLLDQTVPTGSSWHSELIEQMRLDLPGLRPALVPLDAVSPLYELRKFRHFFRNAYAVDLDLAKIRARARDLEAVAPAVIEAFDRFAEELARAVQELTAT
ncbi:MAG TPA: hypothetical protein VHO06_01820 [Polyangia bacterium]|nr:hypothetical protein [Polyangia bacterium]